MVTSTLPLPHCPEVPLIFGAPRLLLFTLPAAEHSAGRTVDSVSSFLDCKLLEGRDHVFTALFINVPSTLHGTEAPGTNGLTGTSSGTVPLGPHLCLPCACSSWLMTHSWFWATGSTPSAPRTTSLVPCRSTQTSSTSSPLCCSWWGVVIKEHPQFCSTWALPSPEGWALCPGSGSQTPFLSLK